MAIDTTYTAMIPIAMGQIVVSSAATLTSGCNVASVSYLGTGAVQVTISLPSHGGASVPKQILPQVTLWGAGIATTVEAIDNGSPHNAFTVNTRNASTGALVDTSFSFVVYATPGDSP